MINGSYPEAPVSVGGCVAECDGEYGLDTNVAEEGDVL